MDEYLHFMSGPHRMLMRVGAVCEVTPVEAGHTGGQHVLWRGNPLPVDTARRLLDLDSGDEGILIVHGPNAAPRGLLVDRVIGLCTIADRDFTPLSAKLPAPILQLFDCACHETGGPYLLRCRDDWATVEKD